APPAQYQRNRGHGPGKLRRDEVDRPGAEVSVEEGSFLPPRGEAPGPVHPPIFDGDVPHDPLCRGTSEGRDPGENPRRVDERSGERRRGRPRARRPAHRRAAGDYVIRRSRQPQAQGPSTELRATASTGRGARPSLIGACSRFIRYLEKRNDILLLTTSTR